MVIDSLNAERLDTQEADIDNLNVELDEASDATTAERLDLTTLDISSYQSLDDFQLELYDVVNLEATKRLAAWETTYKHDADKIKLLERAEHSVIANQKL